jgi:RimJ/RimL family protein N-acetyltransferase
VIETARLRLVPATIDTLRAELASPSALAGVIRMEVAEEWPPELYDRDPIEFTIRRLERAPEEAHWWLYYFSLKRAGADAELAIGCGGYKGPPRAGEVEIGYSIVPEHRRRGFASEAAAGLVRNAFGYDDVDCVSAETLPGLRPSIGVLEKCGFRYVGRGSDDGVIRYALARAEWQARELAPRRRSSA